MEPVQQFFCHLSALAMPGARKREHGGVALNPDEVWLLKWPKWAVAQSCAGQPETSFAPVHLKQPQDFYNTFNGRNRLIIVTRDIWSTAVLCHTPYIRGCEVSGYCACEIDKV
ncbi:unnamed protein product [Caretta caretta]